MIDLDDYFECECGILINIHKCCIKKERREWYGTDIEFKCPVCKTENIINLNDGYYK